MADHPLVPINNHHVAHDDFCVRCVQKKGGNRWTAVIDPGRRLISRVTGWSRRFVGRAGYFLMENGTMGMATTATSSPCYHMLAYGGKSLTQ